MVMFSSTPDLTILTGYGRFTALGPLSMLAGAALIAPRLQLFTYLMCKDLDHAGPWDPSNPDTRPDVPSVAFTRPMPCATDPVVQANVAKLLTSRCHSIS